MKPRKEITACSSRPGKSFRAATAADLLGGAAGKPAQINRKWRRHYRRLIELRDQFLSERAELAKESSEEPVPYSMHMADAGTDCFDRDFALSLLSAKQDSIYEIEQAIKRIEYGAYGICELTGKPISQARLQAIPWTRFSVEAERQLEKDGSLIPNRLRPRASVMSPEGDEGDELEEEEEQKSAKTRD